MNEKCSAMTFSSKFGLGILIFFFGLFSLFFMTGCGGGGGSGSSSAGLGNDPLEVEVDSFLDVFFNDISTKKNDSAMVLVSDSLKYYRSGTPNELGKAKFSEKLNAFSNQCATLSVTFENRSVAPFSESYARVRGVLKTQYSISTDSQLISLQEICDIEVERIKDWQIKVFSGKDLVGANFPPDPIQTH
ncbi:MAG: hypothetical protein HQM08_23240 [Candidatus Riflebacteria bacterium]|nr:hypothetical protein [Candidatus Riflebacteria bacterium]